MDLVLEVNLVFLNFSTESGMKKFQSQNNVGIAIFAYLGGGRAFIAMLNTL